jgi:hypothetical protein
LKSSRLSVSIFLLGLSGATTLHGDVAAAPPLTLQISQETAPAGGWVQLKISLAVPALVGSGRIVMDLDPSVFGNIGTVSVFSAAGDAYGIATAQGQHLDASFTSPSGGIGQLRNLPILVATVPILQNAAPGAMAAIAVDPSQSTWQDPMGNTYSVTVVPGSVTFGGSLSVQGVTPGGGLLPAGAKLQVQGSGFTPQTTVTIDGVVIASTAFVSPQEIDVTLGAPAEMTGKRLVLTNPSASGVTYFASLGGVPPSSWLPPGPPNPLFPNAQPVFPLEAQLTGIFAGPPGDSPGGAIGLQNAMSTPVAVTLTLFALNSFSSSTDVTIPPYSAALYSIPDLNTIVASANAPLRMVGLYFAKPLFPSQTAPPPGLSLVGLAPTQQIQTYGLARSFTWQIGTAPPQPLSISISGSAPGLPFDYGVTASTANGGPWLSVTPTKGTSAGYVSIMAAVNPTGLSPGTYTGAITIIPAGGIPQPAAIPVTMTVIPANYVTLSPSYLSALTFFVFPSGPAPSPQTLNLTSGAPVPLTVTSSIQSGGNWFTATVSSTTTPASLTVTPNAAGLAVGMYSGTILITGPQNSITLPVSLSVFGPPQLRVQRRVGRRNFTTGPSQNRA